MINIEEVRQYNEELKRNKERANTLMAQKELYERELNSKCLELSKELGVEVTKDNLMQIYNEYEERLRQTLETGRAVLQKIVQAEQQNTVVQQQEVNQNQMFSGQTTSANQFGVPIANQQAVNPLNQFYSNGITI